MKKLSNFELQELYLDIQNEKNLYETLNENTPYEGWGGKFRHIPMCDVKNIIKYYMKNNSIKGTVSKPYYNQLVIKIKSEIDKTERKELIDFINIFNWNCTNASVDYFDTRFYVELKQI